MSLFTSENPGASRELTQPQEQFQPTWDENTTRQLIKQYKNTPGLYGDRLEGIRQHAHYYNVPFYEGEFDLVDAIKQAGAGFVEGFTTLSISDPADNEYEQILRNLGHLAGFAPGIIAGPAKLVGAKRLAGVAAALNKKSIPMASADFLTKKAKTIINPAIKTLQASRSGTTKTAADFLLGNKARHIMEGAFHLGAASAVSSWQGGVDAMMEGFTGGALAGGVFRTIGNVKLDGSERAQKAIRGLAGSLFMGIPSTMRGATTPEQVYEYVMGAYFGGQERPWTQAKAGKFMQKINERAKTDKEIDISRDPELMPEYEGLPPEVKPLVKKMASETFGDPELRRYIHSRFTEEVNPEALKGKEIKEIPGFETKIEKDTGEAVYVPTKKTLERYKAVVTSGAAEGSDQLWGAALTKRGVPVIHYSFKGGTYFGHDKAEGLAIRQLKESQLEQANKHVLKANETLGRKIADIKKTAYNLIRRNWYQVKDADAVYAIGDIVRTTSEAGKNTFLINRSVKGGTGWGVQMALDKGKSVNVYDIRSKSWHKYDYSANRFVKVDKPPAPPKKWAGIGTRFAKSGGVIPPHVTEAVNKFVSDNYRLKKVQPTKEEIAEIKQAQKDKTTVRDYLPFLKKDLESRQADLDRLIKEKADKEQIDVLKKEVESLEAEYIEKLNEDKIYKIDISTGEVKVGEPIAEVEGIENIDIGERNVGHGPLSFTRRYLTDAWEIGNDVLNRDKQFEIADFMQTSKQDFITNTTENLSEKWADAISEKYEVPLGREARGKLRQQMARDNMSKQITMLGFDNKGGLKILNPMGSTKVPITGGGNRKRIQMPDTIIQQAFKEQGGKGSVWSMLDHITVVDKNGRSKDVDITRYLTSDLFYKNKQNIKAAQAEFDNIKARIMGEADKEGFYFYSGKGDNDRMYFVKYNPKLNNFSDLKISKLRKLLKDNNMLKDFERSEKEFISKYKYQGIPKTKNRFMDSYLSNMLYDLQMNGFKTENWNDVQYGLGEFLNKNNDFITSSKAFNKRSQIWFTDSMPGDGAYIESRIKNPITGKSDLQDGKLKYTIIRDLPKNIRDKIDKDKLFSSDIKRASNELGEHVDGAIIMRDDVVNSILMDAGMPESGQNKSFIISRGEVDALGQPLGALLGKYMIHKAGPKMSEAMGKENLHMYMQETAVKQRGRRQYGDLSIEKGVPKFTGEQYSLSPSDIKYNYSVVNNKHMLQPQRIPKQLLSSMLDNLKSPIPKEVVDDIFNSTVGDKFKGTEAGDALLENYFVDPSINNLKKLRKNFSELGIQKILDGIKDTNYPEFGDMAYREMLRIQRESFKEDLQSGEITKEQYNKEMQMLGEYESQTERRINSALRFIAGQKEKMSPISVLLHKDMRDWRMQVFRNYIVREATKPRIDNSGVARMRPYDLALQADLDVTNPLLRSNNKNGINNNSQLFMLDNAYKDMPIKTEIKGFEKTTLDKLWSAFERGELNYAKNAVEEVFRATVLRVPMDSISGAHILKFGGFTGRDGHGILLHSRSMRALGGADLDGDEAFFFFGSENHGMRKSWKDHIHANKEEFYEKIDKRTIVRDNKASEISPELRKELNLPNHIKTMRDLLTISGDLSKEDARHLSSFGAMYSPTERMRITESTVKGRMALGQSAIVPKQIMAVAHSALVNSKSKEDRIEITRKGKDGKPKAYELIVKPKTEDRWRNYARELARAQVAFSSDPMDELGLRSHAEWFKQLWGAHFKVTGVVDKSTGKKVKHIPYKDIKASELQGGLYKLFKDINSAYWGRNWAEGRRYTMGEIRDMSSGVFDLEAPQINSMLAKTGKLLGPLDWTDSVFRRIKSKEVLDLYDQTNETVKSYKWLQKLLGRTSLKVPRTKLVEAALNNDIYDPVVREKIAKSNYEFTKLLQMTKERVGGKDVWTNKLGVPEEVMKDWQKSYQNKERVLDYINKRAEDFLYNDLTDMITIKNIVKISEKMSKKELANFVKIHKKTEDLKNKSWLMARDTGRDAIVDLADIDPFTLFVLKKWSKESPEKMASLPPHLRYAFSGERSKRLDQNQIDSAIRKFKKDLTPNEKELFDQLMLGSLRRGKLADIAELEARLGSRSQLQPLKELLKDMRYAGARTSTSRLGYSSREVSDQNIDQVTGDLITMLHGAEKLPPPPPKEIAKKQAELAGNVRNELLGHKESPVEKTIDTVIEEKTTGYEGLEKGVQITQVPKEMRGVLSELVSNVKTYNNKVGQNINEIVRSLFGKDLNAMNFQDYRALNEWFKSIKRGTIWQRLFDKGQMQKLRKRHWYMFPATINRELMRDDMHLMREEGSYLTKDAKTLIGRIERPTHYIDIVQQWISRMNDAGTEQAEKWIRELKERLLFLDAIPDGEVLRQIAVRRREANYAEVNTLSTNPKINAMFKSSYTKPYQEILKENSDLLSKEYTVTVEGERRRFTGSELVDRADKQYTEMFTEMHKLMTGKINDKGVNLALEEGGFVKEYADPDTRLVPIIDTPKFIRHLTDSWRKGKNPSLEFGVDGLRKVARSMMRELANKPGYEELKKALQKPDQTMTGKIDYQFYWPHMFFNKKKAAASFKAAYEAVERMPLSEFGKDVKEAKANKAKELRKIIHKHHNVTGEWYMEDINDWNAYEEALDAIDAKRATKEDKIKWFSANERTGSMQTRGNHIEGWSVDSNVADSYIRSLSNAYYRQLSQIFSRKMLNQMYNSINKKQGKEQASAWDKFMKLYVQDAMGHPTNIPDYYLKDKSLNLQGTAYAWWADNKTAERIDKMRDKLGLTDTSLPPELRKTDLQTVRHWSNLEAQYEMASLLAHPKSMVTNIFGGTLHTVQSAGWQSFKNSRNIKWLKQNINPEWNSMKDVSEFVERAGVIPEYMLYESGLNKEFKESKNRQFIEEVAQKLSKSPKMKETTLREIADKYKVKDNIMQFAAKFMTVPERAIRRDAFMAHYINAWNKFGGALKDPSHPYLIEMAKKGVKATQFLYSAPFRPAFARTSLGKVMTRFQLWSWNAVRFRNDVYREAKIYGLKPGSEAYDKFVRTAQIDLFVFALANVFAYSIFETALPAPWNWFQDTADWIFGDEKERDRAFFGQWPKQLAPLQMVTPPVFRLLPSSMRALVDDDWSKFSQYYVWTMFPFGRMARDIAGPKNLIENPIRVMEKLTGFPLLQAQKKATELKDSDYKPPTPGGF